LRHQYAIPRDALVLLTLSRISVEKGQDLLLRALLDWERRSDFPRQPVWLFICGDAAYMQGHRFLRRLQSLAARLRKTRVIFTGHVTGIRKQAFFALASLCMKVMGSHWSKRCARVCRPSVSITTERAKCCDPIAAC